MSVEVCDLVGTLRSRAGVAAKARNAPLQGQSEGAGKESRYCKVVRGGRGERLIGLQNGAPPAVEKDNRLAEQQSLISESSLLLYEDIHAVLFDCRVSCQYQYYVSLRHV